jgi:isopenicillin N synthase-like dioxygenase
MTTYEDLPIVAFDRIHEGNREEQARRLVGLCQEVGFFRLVDYPQAVHEQYARIRSMMREFLSLDQATKNKYIRDDGQGYIPCWRSVFNGSDPDPRELMAFRGYFDMGYPVPGLADEVGKMEAMMRPIMNELLAMVEIGLELPARALSSYVSNTSWACVGHHYLRMDELQEKNKLRVDGDRYVRLGEHADTSLITFVMSDKPGLEVQDLKSSDWIRAQTGGLTVNIGDALARVTNDTLRSTIHRVCGSREDMASQRFTCSFLYYPARESVLRVVEGGKIRGANKQGGVYEPMTFAAVQQQAYERQVLRD